MSGLFSTLGSSVKALNAHSRALDRNGSVYADFEVPDLSRQPLAELRTSRSAVQWPA